MKKKLLIVALGLILLFALYTFLFNMSPGQVYNTGLLAFDKDGFVDAMELNDTDKLVTQNTDYILYLDETTSHFKVVEKATGYEWESNPSSMDPWQLDLSKSITQSAIDKQKATLELSYFNETGGLATITNYGMSISHPASVLFSAGLRTYQIKYLDNGFQVLYQIQDVDIDYLYFPKYLEKDVLESLEQREILEALAYTGYDEELGLYEITQYEDMSRLVRTRLYDVFYGEDGLGYTRERAIAENSSYGYTETFEHVYFEIAVEVELTDHGVKTSVVQNSIVEEDNGRVATVSLYPHFGTAVSEVDGEETEGYLVIPDGSGAIIEFNNGKHYQQPYSKRLYGVDIGIMDYKLPEIQQDILIPLYGMVKEDHAFAAIITEGDTMATINADVSGRIDSYNKVYPTFNFREVEAVTIGSGFNSYGLDLWTENRVNSDFTVDYSFLSGEEANYVGIASTYRSYLEVGFAFDSTDLTTETVLTTELIGAYDEKTFALGVPYYRNASLTSFDESQIILQDFLDRDIYNINVIYRGMINGGLTSGISDEFDIERVLGGKRDYSDLIDFSSQNGITIFPHTMIAATSDYNKMFDQFRYTSSRIDGSQSILFEYHLASKLPLSMGVGTTEHQETYVINPLYHDEIFSDFLKDYDGDAISLELIGRVLGGSYEDNATYKQDTLQIHESILAKTEEDLLLSSPLGYAYPYVDYITDLPLEMTRYAILDYQIPLLQLILSGKVDYSSISLNLDNERSVQYNFLKAIETGSNLKYTLSYDDSKELKETEHNEYLSTKYDNWIDRIEDQVKELDEIGIHSGYLIGHEQVQSNVVVVTYSHGLEVLINYNLSEVTVNGETIPPMSYSVLEVE